MFGALLACDALTAKGQMVKHEWWPSESAPRGAPIFFLRGDLTLADGGSLYVPDNRITGKGWGEIGSTHLVGDDAKALPRQVALSWYSYAENRFWAGQFPIPDRLATLMTRGAPMPDGRPREKYDRIIFGMAPEGNVSMWASAGPVVTEIATFKAAPTERPWTDVVTNPEVERETHIREVLDDNGGPGTFDRVRANPAGLQVWNDYPRRFAWVPQLVGASAQGSTVWIKGLNGEFDWADLADPTRGGEPLPNTLAMPAALTLKWRLPGVVRAADIILDPAEVVAAFKKLSVADRAEPMTLMLEPSPSGQAVDVFLRRGDLAYRFKNNQTKIYGGN